MGRSIQLPKLISRIVAKKKRRKIRVIMRGYRKLKAQGELHLIHELKDILMDERFELINNCSSRIMFGASSENASLVVRQYLNLRLLNLKFNKAILYSLGSGKPIRYPLPAEWRKILEREKYIVDGFSCHFQWVLFLFIYFCYGIYRAFNVFKTAISFNKVTNSELVLPFAYFHNLSQLNIPSISDGNVSKNILSWYAEWAGRDEKIMSFHHDAKNTNNIKIGDANIYYAPLTQLNIRGAKSLLFFSGWLIMALAICIKDLLLFRWWTFLLFEQYVQAAKLKYAEDKIIAKDYLFHQANHTYRPLWTYEVEKRGARVILYFYSTNNAPSFKKVDGYVDYQNIFKLSFWPLILVWDKFQEQFVKRLFLSCGEIEIVGEIWFSSNNFNHNIDLNLNHFLSAGLFDVQPHRSSRWQTYVEPSEYYDSKVAIQFLKDVHKVLDDNSIVALHKGKRKIGNMLHPKYRKILSTFSGKNQISIDSGASANYLIENVDFVVSMPFTSTALIARYDNKPSIYYDPFGDVQKDDRAAHGIQVIIGIDELQIWIKDVMLKINKLQVING